MSTKRETNELWRCISVRRLGERRPDVAENSLIAMLEDSSMLVRLHALEELAKFGSGKAVRAVLYKLRDESPEMRNAALRAIRYFLPEAALESFDEKRASKGGEHHRTERNERAWGVLLSVCREMLSSAVGDKEVVSLCTELSELPELRRRLEEAYKEIGNRDMIERLRAANEQRLAQRYPQQLMIAPTYACNLQCPYCYAQDLIRAFPEPMSIENFKKIMDWLEGQECRIVPFTGGEPTIHPHFADFLGYVHDRGYQSYFATNNLFEEAVLEVLQRDFILNVSVHANERVIFDPTKNSIFRRNLGALLEKGIYVYLRYTISTEMETEWDWLFRICSDFNIRVISFALAFPNQGRTNSYIAKSRLESSSELFLRFVEQCQRESIEAKLAKPVPFCAFSEDAQKELCSINCLDTICSLHQNGYTNNVVVNPDLSVFPCIGVQRKLPKLTSFSSFATLGSHIEHEIAALQEKPLFEKCRDCYLADASICQGACLGYK